MCPHWSSSIFAGGSALSFRLNAASISVAGTPNTDVSLAGAQGASDSGAFTVFLSREHAATANASSDARKRFLDNISFLIVTGMQWREAGQSVQQQLQFPNHAQLVSVQSGLQYESAEYGMGG